LAQQAAQWVTKLPESGTPPPLMAPFHVAVGGQASGPFAESALRQMAAAGTLTAGTLVWRAGMATWQAASSVPELAGLFAPAKASPPPLPAGA
jgi:hypothetical protein